MAAKTSLMHANCLRKPWFPTREFAMIAVKKLRKMGRSVKPYRCAACGNFHVTTDRRSSTHKASADTTPRDGDA